MAPDKGPPADQENPQIAQNQAALTGSPSGVQTISQAAPWLMRFVYTLIALGLGLFVALSFLEKIRSLVGILVTALFLSFGLEPAVNWLAGKGWRRGTATAVVIVAALVLGLGFLALLIPVFVTQGERLASNAPQWLADIELLAHRFNIELTTDSLIKSVKGLNVGQVVSDVGSQLTGILGTAAGIVIRIFMIGLFTVYIVSAGPKLRRTVCSILPPKRQRQVLQMWDIAIVKTGGYFYSRALVALVASVSLYLAMLITSFVSPHSSALRGIAIPIAILYGLWDAFIPIIGSYIGAIPPLLLGLVSGNPWNALWLLIFILVYKQFEDYWLAPKFSAKTMTIHPAVAIGSVFGGAEVAGITGALLALPIAAIVQAFLSAYLLKHEVVESHLTSETKPQSRRKKRKDARAARDASEPQADTSPPEESP